MLHTAAIILCYLYLATAVQPAKASRCKVRARIDSGWVCGLIRDAELGVKYASFRGVPYAQQPLGKLRFKELQPVKPWRHPLDATEEGPICPQEDVMFGRLMKPVRGMSESCILANVHVPMAALPKVRGAEDPEYDTRYQNETYRHAGKAGYPIFVFIHGGGFSYGSGDTDLYGPEYLVSQGIIVITFNYRLNVFGFLSLNTPEIPGNAGLRDQLTLLRWVKRNARAFGGDPSEVTLGGHSSGSVSAHLLALSTKTKGLFKRVILMSGSAIPAFYSASPAFASQIADLFLKTVGINSTDSKAIHKQLINMPLEVLINANSKILYEGGIGVSTFWPVIESEHKRVTRIVDGDPFNLIERGRDKEYPIYVSFTNNECEAIRRRSMSVDIIRRIEEDPRLVLETGIVFSTPTNVTLSLAKLVIQKYFHDKLNIDDYLVSCSHIRFEYPSYQLVRLRGEMKAAPTYLSQFTYDSDYSVLKDAWNVEYKGNAHIDDLPYIFRVNSMLGNEKAFPPVKKDDQMKYWMTKFVINYMRCDDPSCGKGWLPVNPRILNYQSVYLPGVYNNTPPTHDEWDMIHFQDQIQQMARNPSVAEDPPARD